MISETEPHLRPDTKLEPRRAGLSQGHDESAGAPDDVEDRSGKERGSQLPHILQASAHFAASIDHIILSGMFPVDFQSAVEL